MTLALLKKGRIVNHITLDREELNMTEEELKQWCDASIEVYNSTLKALKKCFGIKEGC